MKNKIKEVQDYFRSKIVMKAYDIKSIDKHLLKVVVDGEYNFSIWIANGEQMISLYDGDSNTIYFEFNELEMMAVWNNVVLLRKQIVEEEIKKAESEIERLKKQL